MGGKVLRTIGMEREDEFGLEEFGVQLQAISVLAGEICQNCLIKGSKAPSNSDGEVEVAGWRPFLVDRAG